LTTQASAAQDILISLLQTSFLSNVSQKRLEIANLILDDFDNGFTKNRTVPNLFLPPLSESDSAELLLVRGKMSDDPEDLLREASQRANSEALKGLIKFEYRRFCRVSEISRYATRAAHSGVVPAKVMMGFLALKERKLALNIHDVVAQLIIDAAQDGSEIGGAFLFSLLLASGALGIKRDDRRAEAIWRTIDIRDVEGFGPIATDRVRDAKTRFLKWKIEHAASDEEEVRAQVLLGRHWEGDDELALVVLKKAFLNPRFYAVKECSQALAMFLRALLKTKQEHLCRQIMRRIEADPSIEMDGDFEFEFANFRTEAAPLRV
jgi:hypothetical protein